MLFIPVLPIFAYFALFQRGFFFGLLHLIFLFWIILCVFWFCLSYNISHTAKMKSIASSKERRPPQGTSSSLDGRGGSTTASTPTIRRNWDHCARRCGDRLRPPHLTLLKALLFPHPLPTDNKNPVHYIWTQWLKLSNNSHTIWVGQGPHTYV